MKLNLLAVYCYVYIYVFFKLLFETITKRMILKNQQLNLDLNKVANIFYQNIQI
jgi:hypothetical protein